MHNSVRCSILKQLLAPLFSKYDSIVKVLPSSSFDKSVLHSSIYRDFLVASFFHNQASNRVSPFQIDAKLILNLIFLMET